MATKIKRCLYVGLGGTGMNALLHTKKMFTDTYGEVPPMIGFLGIDTDKGAFAKTLLSTKGQEIVLAPNEQYSIQVASAKAIFNVDPESFSWLPEKNLFALGAITHGAGQIRTTGRFAFTVEYSKIVNQVRSALDKITNAKIIDDSRYQLIDNETEIHMVFSVCGGTGSGTFLNMAYLLRQVAPQCKLMGYAVLPGIFKAMIPSAAATARVAPNAYGSIYDLDYLMHFGIGSKPFRIQYLQNNYYDISDRPFNAIVFIDNKNANNDTYTDIDQLTEMIGLALVTSAGELSGAAASVSDNLDKMIAEGTMDIENKKAWAAGMGICEILYKSSTISEIYSIKAAMSLIERLQNSCEDTNAIVNAWIDSSDVNIRENDGNDHVIDFIASKSPKYELSLLRDDYDDPSGQINTYKEQNRLTDDKVSPKISELTDRVRMKLRELLIEHINKECGISTASKIIDGIRSQVNIFIGEMQTEKLELQDKLPKLNSNVDIAVEELKKCVKTILKRGLEEKAEYVCEAVKKVVICEREIVRRTAALAIFNQILSMLDREDNRIKEIQNLLSGAYKQLNDELSKIQNSVGYTSKSFQIDLAVETSKNVAVDNEGIHISEFVKTLSSDKIYSFNEKSMGEIKGLLKNYTSFTNEARNFRQTTIDDVINKMSEEEFSRTIDLSIMKSRPLFRHDYRGHMPSVDPYDSYYIGVPDKATSRLCHNNYFKNKIGVVIPIDFANIGGKDRIIIYRQMGVVPAYAISDTIDYEHEYERCNVNCHFDSNMERRMRSEDFSIYPKRPGVVDLDMLEYWVKGFIFGLIKNEDGKYQLKSEALGKAIDDNWFDLGSSYRDQAYAEFKRYKSDIVKEFDKYIQELASKNGSQFIDERIADVKKERNYWDNYSQINMTKDELCKYGNEKIFELFDKELEYVKTL